MDDDYTVEIADEIEDDVAEVAREVEFSDNREEALSELKSLLAENADSGQPLLRPPLDPDEIERIEDERHQALHGTSTPSPPRTTTPPTR